MTKQQAINFFGSATSLADAIGVSKQAVGQWGAIPYARQYQIHVVSGGELPVDIKHVADA